MAVTSQGKKSIWEDFRKFCKDDDIPGETLSKETLFRVEEPFNDPVPPLVAETPDLISRCHPETPYDDDRPKADRRTDGDWVSEEVDERPNAVDNDLDVDKPKETLQNDERPSAVAIMQAPSFSRIGKKTSSKPLKVWNPSSCSQKESSRQRQDFLSRVRASRRLSQIMNISRRMSKNQSTLPNSMRPP